MRRQVKPKKVAGFREVKKTRGTGDILSPQSVRMVERRYQVMTMRRDGLTIREIADMIGCGPQVVIQDIKEVLGYTIKELNETTEEHRQLELERLDGLLGRYYKLATSGNMSAAALVLNISRDRRKLLALDIPETKKLDVTAVREYIGIDLDQV